MCFCCCDCCCCDCLLIVLAVIFPPLPVCIKRGLCSCDFLINICLCLLGWVPGMIHAWYIILNNPDEKYLIEDDERQIFIVSPPQITHVTINKQPNQTKIKFSHPEPFLESNSKHNSNNNNNSNNNLINSNNLSPLSNTPLLTSSHRNEYVSSPLSRPQNNYSAINNINSDDPLDPISDVISSDAPPPPSYDNVMNETAKQFR